eukprot:TRINITY_DN13337_c1_g2_i3.p1 TRINITY_DN13337_c1_g2~~TRINITY_DN13337_c1_g2_i3.p1  ORF type:complete len:107 (+),score=15.94 TRINITY_DN13337_c1_g2_i3:868-1188(+)
MMNGTLTGLVGVSSDLCGPLTYQRINFDRQTHTAPIDHFVRQLSLFLEQVDKDPSGLEHPPIHKNQCNSYATNSSAPQTVDTKHFLNGHLFNASPRATLAFCEARE